MPMQELRAARNVLRLVQSLHLRGYQQLRVCSGMSPSGAHWRCAITPRSNVLRSHGAMIANYELAAHYSSADGRAYFNWNDAARAQPDELANLFIKRFPSLVEAGRGSDWAYVGWFIEMLHLTYPAAMPIAYADWELPADCLSTVGSPKAIRVPLPPGGEHD